MCDLPWQALLAAFALDLAAGDPRWLPHPIIWMGRAISFFEIRFRRWIPWEFWSGLAFALVLISGTWVLAWGTVRAAVWIHPLAGAFIQTLMLFYAFSVKSLSTAAMDVARPLMAGDMAGARTRVGYIVGRETKSLDRPGVARAACETVAENFVDGFLSPLFFALIFGAPGAMAYKMVNTLDSMVGYKNSTYLFFGRAPARIDDLANFIPARVSVLVIALSAGLLNWSRGKKALFTALNQGKNHKSPNAGYPEAAFAGALMVRMGGPNLYHGKLVDKPYIGGEFRDPGPDKIERTCELMILSALVSVLMGALILWGIL